MSTGSKDRQVFERSTKSTINPLSILQVCCELNEEATPIFYRHNQFRIHSAHANFNTALEFLNSLSSTARESVTSLEVVGLQPYDEGMYGRYGIFPEPSGEFRRKSCRYRLSENVFYRTIQEMPLKELSLGFDLSHIRGDFRNEYTKEYSPQAWWLNGFLRLLLKRINLDFGNMDWKARFGQSPPDCVDALNHVDGQQRIRAKYEWEDEYRANHTCEDQDLERSREVEKELRPTYPYNDIWA